MNITEPGIVDDARLGLRLDAYSPDYIGVMGDTHANTRWTLSVIEEMSVRLGQLGQKLPRFILQAGDFGIWADRSGMNFLQQVNLMLSAKGAVIAFVPGNHEDYGYIQSWESDNPPGCPNIYALPRGRRWVWQERTWLALGGAISPDKSVRKPMVDWFPQEAITYKQAVDVANGGPADVMLTHDAPTGVPLKYADPPPYFFKQEDLDKSEKHRELLRSVVNEVEPKFLIHGHYHQGSPRWRSVPMPHGELKVASLHMDGCDGNWGILDIRNMEWV